jgi:DNA polymerase III delta subunit
MITTLTGENETLRAQMQRQIVDTFVAVYGDMGLERIDGEEASYGHMHEAVQSLPFLAGRKLVVLRSPSANKEFVESFEQFLQDVAETNDVLIVEPKLDKRLSYYKRLKKDTDFKELKVLDSSALAAFAMQHVKGQGGTLSSGDARLLIERVGDNQLIVQHELDKLLAYDCAISKGTIELLTERTPASSIFELLDAAFAGNTKRAMALYHEQRALRVEPQQIIAMLVWQLHILAIAATAGNRSADEIAGQAKISPFTVRKSLPLARRIGAARLKHLIISLREFDIRLKSEPINADEVVQYYLLNVAH